MQTFLPYYDFAETASILDTPRLNKQLLEGRQIMTLLLKPDAPQGYAHHPAVKMWRGSEDLLFEYLMQIRMELQKRRVKTSENWGYLLYLQDSFEFGIETPTWFTVVNVPMTHRANLYRKDPEHYALFKPNPRWREFVCGEGCDYYWPTHITEGRHGLS